MNDLRKQALEAIAENQRLLQVINELQSDLIKAEVRRTTELKRARFIIRESLNACKVPHDKAVAAMKDAAEAWSASRRMVR
jgi:ABC-type phosphate transport system auxiliary subunit